MRLHMLAVVLVLPLLTEPPGAQAQSAPLGPQEPGTYVFNLASGTWRRVGTRAVVAWSPDSRLLAVAESTDPNPAGGGARIIEVATGRETPVPVPARSSIARFRWSPDGSRLAFTVNPFGPGDPSGLYVLSATQGPVQELLPTAVSDFVWTPDGQAITAIAWDDPGRSLNGRIITLDAGTGTIRATIHSGSDVACLASLAWSRDGAYLAFGGPGLTQPCGDLANLGLWSWEASTGTTRRLVTGLVDGPFWTPDGDILAMLAVPTGEARASRSVVRYHPDGRGSRILAEGIPPSLALAARPFQAAGETVLYTVLRCDVGAVFVVGRGDTPPRELSAPGSFAYWPALSPDGAMVAWGTRGAQGNDLVRAAVDDGEPRTVLQAFPGLVVIGWSADSGWLTFLVTAVSEPSLPC